MKSLLTLVHDARAFGAALFLLLAICSEPTAGYAQDCRGVIAADTLAALDTGGDVDFCLDLDYRIALRSERTLDGQRLTAFAQGCNFDTLVFYPYFTFPYQGTRGPYVLEEWTVDGRSLRDTFGDVAQLITLLNAFDAGGNWTNDQITKNLVGGVRGRRYGAMRILHIADGTRRDVAVNYQSIAGGTRVAVRGPGYHTYSLIDPRTNCRDTLTLFVKPSLADRRDTVYTRAQTLSRSFCVDNSGLIGSPQTASFCSTGTRGRVSMVSPYCFTYAPPSGFSGSETLCIEVCDDTPGPGGPVCQRTFVTVVTGSVQRPVTDTIRVTIGTRDTTVCLGAALQLARPITSTSGCSVVSADLGITPTRSGCVDLRPTSGFSGVVEGCVVHCSQGVCDTTRLIVTVALDCRETVFATARDSIADGGTPTAYCLAVPPAVLAEYRLAINGTPYTGRVGACTTERAYAYNYAPLLQAGSDGPYTLLSWTVDGQDIQGPFAGLSALVALMNGADPQGNWRLDPANFLISGGRPDGSYGNLQIVHDGTGAVSDLVPNPIEVSAGSSIDVPGRGTYVITVVNVATGCRDALTLKVGADLPAGTKQVVVVPVTYGRVSPQTCLFDAPRDTVRVCERPRSGTATLEASGCITYQPRVGFVGRDTMCVVTCTLPSGSSCDTAIVIFEVTRPELLTDTVRLQSFGESPLLACANVPFDGPFQTASICGIQGAFVATPATGTCLTITAAPETTQAGEICVEYCSQVDPSYCQRVVFVITPTVTCAPDLFLQDSLTLAPSPGITSVCLGEGVDLSEYTITVDRGSATLLTDPSCGTTVGTGGGGGTQTVLSYTTVFLDEANPLRIEGWDIGGALVSGVEAMGLSALADSMSAYDPAATWTYNRDAAMIVADVGTGSYSMMILFDLASGSVFTLPLETTTTTGSGGTRFVPGTVVELPTPGRYLVNAVRNDGTCGDQQLIYRQPPQRPRRDTIRQQAISEQINGPYCLPTDELGGAATSIDLCGAPSNGLIGLSGSNCYTYTPDPGYVGRDEVCIVLCAEGGLLCDTTVIVLDVVVEPALRQTRDTVTHQVTTGVESQVFCLSSAQLPSAPDRRSFCGDPLLGSLTFASATCYTYTSTAGFVGTDEACVVLCSGTVCDTTVLRFVVRDARPPVGSASDTLRIEVERDVLSLVFCLPTTTLPSGPIDLTGCGLPGNGNLTFVSDSCFTYFPDSGFVGSDTACVTMCSGAICATTIVLIEVRPTQVVSAPVRDTVRLGVIAGRVNGPYCIDVSQLPGGVTQSTACGAPQHGELTMAGTTCYTYEPTAGYIGRDTACMILCSGTICDTTLLVFEVALSGPTCDNFSATTPLNFDLTNCDSTARFEFTTGSTDLSAVVLTLDSVEIVGQRSGTLIAVTLPVGTYALVARDTVQNCQTTFAITVSCNANCQLPFAATDIRRVVNCDTGLVSICLPTTPAALADFAISVDGEPYTGTVEDCGSEERVVYDVNDLGGGPFRVDSLTIGRTFFSADVASLSDLADSLQVWDGGTRWTFDATSRLLSGGIPTRDYGALRITELSILRVSNVLPIRETVAAGVLLRIPAGVPVTSLRFTSQVGTCQQDLRLTVECASNRTEAVSVEVDGDLLYCVDAVGLNGPVVSLANACPTTDSIADLDFDAVLGCVTLRGVRLGTREVCLVACDRLGVCDTTFVTVTVTRPAVGDPVLAEDDDYRIMRDAVLRENLTDNDSFTGGFDTIRLLTLPSRGRASVDENGVLTYEPTMGECDFTDTLLYEICQGTICDQATVSIRVRCGLVEVYRGFSPNGDGINDFFAIEGIEAYPNSTIRVYNRWGNEVFVMVGYANDWAGTWTDKTLTNGTYFYLLEIPGEEPISGWVELAR